jgi:outer membrane protein assembly factor BamB
MVLKFKHLLKTAAYKMEEDAGFSIRKLHQPHWIKRTFFLLLLMFLLIPMASRVSGKVVEYWTEDERLEKVAVSADGRYIVASSWENTYLLDSSGDLVWRKEVSGAVSISADGGLIVVASSHWLQLFDRNGNLLLTKDLGTSNSIEDVSSSSSGSYIAAVISELKISELGPETKTKVCLLDQNGEELWSYPLGESAYTVAISSNGDYVAAGSFDQYVYFLDGNGHLLWKYKAGSTVSSVSISPDGNYVAACAYSLYFLDKNGNLLWGGEEMRETWGSHDVSVSNEGTYIAVTDGSRDITLYDREGKVVWSFYVAEEKALEDIAISADGKLIAATTRALVSGSLGLIYLLDNPPGNEVIKKPSTRPSIIRCGVSPSSTLIGKMVTVSGAIEPPHTAVEVKLIYQKPDNTLVKRTVFTDNEGIYRDSFLPDQLGSWRVNASWSGSGEYLGSETSSWFEVETVEEKREPQTLRPGDRITMEIGEKTQVLYLQIG